MPFTGVDHLDHSIDTTNRWLDDLAEELATGPTKARAKATVNIVRVSMRRPVSGRRGDQSDQPWRYSVCT